MNKFYVELNAEFLPAYEFATRAHAGQKYTFVNLSGAVISEDYVRHCWRVARLVKLCDGTESQVISAYLHDVLEDTNTTYGELRQAFGRSVAQIVFALTRRSGESYNAFIDRIVYNSPQSALLVKLCDIEDNMGHCTAEGKPSLLPRYTRAAAELIAALGQSSAPSILAADRVSFLVNPLGGKTTC